MNNIVSTAFVIALLKKWIVEEQVPSLNLMTHTALKLRLMSFRKVNKKFPVKLNKRVSIKLNKFREAE